jgi:taurine dioxygenase
VTALTVTALTSAVGAEVCGVDLAADLDDATIDAVRAALLEHLVLFFRDQHLGPDEQIRFAERFGPISIPTFTTGASDRPEIIVLDQLAPKGEGADSWHADNTYMAEPPMGSILRAVSLPALGGDTCFASMYAAYEALSPALRGFLDGLTAVHDIGVMVERTKHLEAAGLRESAARWPAVVHPVVRIHPETGRKLLNVNANWTVRICELGGAESAALLGFLLEHLKSPDFQCRFHWSEGTVAFWDNRVVQHYAVPDYTERRVMARVTVAGDRPYGPHAVAAEATAAR